MKSDLPSDAVAAVTPDEYVQGLPEERREAITAVRDVILANLPEGYEEVINFGMITYEVPLSTYPDTYNKQPLMYAALASQKRHMAVYLSGLYSNPEDAEAFEAAYRATGKRFDMGKSCVRFKKLDHLPLELIGDAIAKHEVPAFISLYLAARAR